MGELRRTRIVCISDTHNSQVKLPKGDVLIHAGDLTNQGSFSELERTVAWLEEAPFESKIVIAGNHDITLDAAFYQRCGPSFHNQSPQSTEKCLGLLANSRSITYLNHGSSSVFLASKRGPHTRFKVFGSPYSPRDGKWAFAYERTGADSADVWTALPDDADIVITHTPPLMYCDWSATKGRAVGCNELGCALRRSRPRLAICGHVHEGRGAVRVRWSKVAEEQGEKTGSSETRETREAATAAEAAAVEVWDDPGQGSTRLSLVDLTARGGKRALDNDGTATGRDETCIVNCAITATNYPHAGGKRFHKPVVVDLDLPVWNDGDGVCSP